MARFAKFYLMADLLLIAFGIFIGKIWLINSQVGFFGSFLIIFLSYKSLKSKIFDKVAQIKFEGVENPQIADENGGEKVKFLSPATLYFFAPLKILAYVLFFGALILLVKFKIFSPFGLICGISVIPLLTLILKFKE